MKFINIARGVYLLFSIFFGVMSIMSIVNCETLMCHLCIGKFLFYLALSTTFTIQYLVSGHNRNSGEEPYMSEETFINFIESAVEMDFDYQCIRETFLACNARYNRNDQLFFRFLEKIPISSEIEFKPLKELTTETKRVYDHYYNSYHDRPVTVSKTVGYKALNRRRTGDYLIAGIPYHYAYRQDEYLTPIELPINSPIADELKLIAEY